MNIFKNLFYLAIIFFCSVSIFGQDKYELFAVQPSDQVVNVKIADLNSDQVSDIIGMDISSGGAGVRLGYFEYSTTDLDELSAFNFLIALDFAEYTDYDVIDVDDDADMDIVAFNGNAGSLVLLENDGFANFSEQIILSDLGTTKIFEFTDFNNDGIVDLLLGHVGLNDPEYVVHELFLQENDGTFNSVSQYDFEMLEDDLMYLRDFNGDGFTDVFVGRTNGLSWYTNANGLFDLQQEQVIDEKDGTVFQIELQNMDEDTDEELVVYRYLSDVSDEPYPLELIDPTWGGGGQVDWSHHLITASWGNGLNTSFQFEDQDGDGISNLWLLELNSLVKLLNEPNSLSFSKTDYFQFSNNSNGTSIFAFFSNDFNLDGRTDFLLHTTASLRSFTTARNIGEAFFDFGTPVLDVPQTYHILVDTNDDGLQDILTHISGSNPTQLGVMIQGAPLEFEEAMDLFQVEDYPTFLKLETSNANLTEVIVRSEDSIYHAKFDNLGGYELNAISSSSSHLLSADIDGDGDLDLLKFHITNQFTNKLFPILNESGSFVDLNSSWGEWLPLHSENSDPIFIGDFNGDGIDDVGAVLVTTDAANTPIELHLLLSANGVFGSVSTTISVSSPNDFKNIRAVDFDQDGHEDVIYAKRSENDTRLNWIKNCGGSEFELPKEIFKSKFDLIDFIVGDVDLDGDNDLIVHNENGYYWYKNFAFDVFQPEVIWQRLEYSIQQGWEFDYLDIDGNGEKELCVGALEIFRPKKSDLPQPSFEVIPCSLHPIQNTSTGLAYSTEAFMWEFDIGHTTSEIHPLPPFNSSNTFELTLTACVDDQCQSITEEVELSHYAQPFIPTSGDPGVPVSFGVDYIGFTNVTWEFGDGEVSVESDTEKIYNEEGAYEVNLYLTDANIQSCTQVVTQYIIIGDVVSSYQSVRMAPNPFEGTLQLFNEFPFDGEKFFLDSIHGETSVSATLNGSTVEIPTDHLSHGVYVARIYRGDTLVYAGKVVCINR